MVSAIIQNTFSAGYAVSATGDAPVQIPTSYLSNLDFELVDANFTPIVLLSPMYLTISVTPVTQDLLNDLSQWNDKLPRDAPTPEQKALQDAQAKAQADAQAEADKDAKDKADIQQLACELIVQVLSPIVQQQMVQQQVAIAEMKLNEVKQGVVQHLLQDPEVLAYIETLPKNQVVPFIKKLTKEIMKEAAREGEGDENDTQEGAPIETPIEEAPADQPLPETPVEAPAEPEPVTETVQEPTPEETPPVISLDDLPITGTL
jgi:hypothetical protein